MYLLKYSLLALGVIVFFDNAQAQEYDWVHVFDNVDFEDREGFYSQVHKVKSVNDGFVFSGIFKRALVVKGDTLYTSNAFQNEWSFDEDILLFKTDREGNVLWKHQMGGNDSYQDEVTALCVDTEDNIFTGGIFKGEIRKIDSGLVDLEKFIIKWDSNGDTIWTKSIEYIPSNMTSDGNGNLYVVGSYNGKSYIEKFNTQGDLSWTRVCETTGNTLNVYSYFLDVAVNNRNEILIIGTASKYINDATFLLGNLTFTISEDQSFLAKLDVTGNFKWINLNLPPLTQVESDQNDDFWISGSYDKTFISSNVEFSEDEIQAANCFFAKVNSSNQTISEARIIGSTNNISISDLCIGSEGSVYLSGEYKYNAIFSDKVSSSSGNQSFVARYTTSSQLYNIYKVPVLYGLSNFKIDTDPFNNNLVFGGTLSGIKVFGDILLNSGIGYSMVYGVIFQDDLQVITGNSLKENLDIKVINPVNDELQIISDQKIWSIQLQTSEGKMVYSKRLKGETSGAFTMSDITSGVYILKIVTDKGFESFKILKQ